VQGSLPGKGENPVPFCFIGNFSDFYKEKCSAKIRTRTNGRWRLVSFAKETLCFLLQERSCCLENVVINARHKKGDVYGKIFSYVL
jgi:hypothetical protein